MSKFEFKGFPVTVNEAGYFTANYEDKVLKAASLSALKSQLRKELDSEVMPFKALIFAMGPLDKDGEHPDIVKEVTVTRKENVKFMSGTYQSHYQTQLYATSERKRMEKLLEMKAAERKRRDAANAKISAFKTSIKLAIPLPPSAE